MARKLTAIPGIVLIVCLFLPALRVCGHPDAPITFPPCYAAYLGGIGVAIVAIARRGWLVKLGAAIPPVLGVLTLGGILACSLWNSPPLAVLFASITLGFAIAVVRMFARTLPGERVLATIAIAQGGGSALWAAALAFEHDGLWGARLTLCAALALAVSGRAWLRETESPLPRAAAF